MGWVHRANLSPHSDVLGSASWLTGPLTAVGGAGVGAPEHAFVSAPLPILGLARTPGGRITDRRVVMIALQLGSRVSQEASWPVLGGLMFPGPTSHSRVDRESAMGEESVDLRPSHGAFNASSAERTRISADL